MFLDCSLFCLHPLILVRDVTEGHSYKIFACDQGVSITAIGCVGQVEIESTSNLILGKSQGRIRCSAQINLSVMVTICLDVRFLISKVLEGTLMKYDTIATTIMGKSIPFVEVTRDCSRRVLLRLKLQFRQ